MEAYGGNIIKKKRTSFTFKKASRVSLSCMLVEVQTPEYEKGLLTYPVDMAVNYRQHYYGEDTHKQLFGRRGES